jgi:predicted metalloprotease
MNHLSKQRIRVIGVIVALMFLSLLGVARVDRVSVGGDGDADQHSRTGQLAAEVPGAGVQGQKVGRLTQEEREVKAYVEDVVYPDLKKFWTQNLPSLQEAWGLGPYFPSPPKLKILIERPAKGPCGTATPTKAMSYCSPNNTIYYGLPLQMGYVHKFGYIDSANSLAHEWGHHVQTQFGYMADYNQSNDVAFENQADCFAGAWTESYDARTNAFSEQDIRLELKALASIGDPRTEQQGKNHGSPKERVKWFKVGLENGDPAQCTTF